MAYADDLIKLCAEVEENYQRMPYDEASNAQRELEKKIQEIGRKLDEAGGDQLMRKVHAEVAARSSHGRLLELAWGNAGVGGWW